MLSADLLRRSQLQTAETLNFPRSQIIQSLSIFASQLETVVQPDEGNYQIAQQGQRAIRHVLDQVLSMPVISTLPIVSDSTLGVETSIFDPVGLHLLEGIDINDRDQFLDWLDGTLSVHDPCLAWTSLT
jgi:hypothetical protein